MTPRDAAMSFRSHERHLDPRSSRACSAVRRARGASSPRSTPSSISRSSQTTRSVGRCDKSPSSPLPQPGQPRQRRRDRLRRRAHAPYTTPPPIFEPGDVAGRAKSCRYVHLGPAVRRYLCTADIQGKRRARPSPRATPHHPAPTRRRAAMPYCGRARQATMDEAKKTSLADMMPAVMSLAKVRASSPNHSGVGALGDDLA